MSQFYRKALNAGQALAYPEIAITLSDQKKVSNGIWETRTVRGQVLTVAHLPLLRGSSVRYGGEGSPLPFLISGCAARLRSFIIITRIKKAVSQRAIV